jgi:hypothetical protein
MANIKSKKRIQMHTQETTKQCDSELKLRILLEGGATIEWKWQRKLNEKVHFLYNAEGTE